MKRKGVYEGTSLYGMVSTASRYATDAGVKILERGGNAVDAAVAAAFCLGVVEPQASGLGGQSMILLHLEPDGRTIALDGSSRAPFVLSPTNVPSKPFKTGLKSSTVPSTPAVLGYLLDTFGTMKISNVVEPAIGLADEGFKISSLQHRLIRNNSNKLIQDPVGKTNFFKNGVPLKAGDLLTQPELARCLRRIADSGWRDFYLGEIAWDIIQDMERRGGLVTTADLSQIPIPVERPVLSGKYRKYRVVTFPPPGAGRVLVAILNTLNNFSREEVFPGTPEGATVMAMAFWNALRDRSRLPMDPAIFPQERKKPLLRDGYAQKIAQRIRRVVADSHQDGPDFPGTSGETTHLSVVDEGGNAVAITQSIERVFGSKMVAGNQGFFYNNYMSTFNYKDMLHPYYLLPGGAPWSTVAPTILFRKKSPYMVLGSPGSDRIPTSVAQVITRIVDGKQALGEAVAAPRIHSTKEGHLHLEAGRFDPSVIEAIERTGLKVTRRSDYSFYMGSVQALQYPSKAGAPFLGVADPRRDGTARGPKGSPRREG